MAQVTLALPIGMSCFPLGLLSWRVGLSTGWWRQRAASIKLQSNFCSLSALGSEFSPFPLPSSPEGRHNGFDEV